MTPRAAFRRLLAFAGGHRGLAATQLALATVSTLLLLVFPGVVRWFVDDLIPQQRREWIWIAGGIAIAAFLLRELIAYLRIRVNTAFEQAMMVDLRRRLHHKLTRLPLSWFDRQSTGDLLTRMANDIPATQRVILEGIEQGVTALLQITVVTVMLLLADPALALIVLAPTPLIAAGGWLYSHWVSPRAREAREAASDLNAGLHETVTGIRQVKGYGAEDLKAREFERDSQNLQRSQSRWMAAWAWYSPSMTFLGNLGLVLLLVVGGLWSIDGRMPLGELMRFLLLIGFLYEPIARLHGVNQVLSDGLAAAVRVFGILDQPEEEDLEAGEPLDAVEGRITFERVGFGYLPTHPTVQEVDLRVDPGQTVAIVGGTGAGKTTLFQLLCRFYDPQQGRITIDGRATTGLRRRDLRNAIGYVTQEPFLFSGNIRDNLLLGRPEADEKLMWQALEAAHAAGFVREKPEGLDARVGERGVQLSGGERQRIALARAFLKDAPILLLDEATSSVDTRSEEAIREAIVDLQKERTCLIIAHRLSTIMGADQIYVMRAGRILAHGSHEELLVSCPYYAELAKLAGEGRRG